MVSADMCEHLWPGSGCPDCRAERESLIAEREKKQTETAGENQMERKHMILGDDHNADTVMAQPASLVGGVQKKRATWFQAPNNKFRVVAGSEIIADNLETEAEATEICKTYNG